jgi:hypothetical protein
VFSLLISILLFAGFTVFAYTGLFGLVESRFYNPSVVRSLDRQLDEDTRAIRDFLAELQSGFAASLMENAVRGSFILNQKAEDIFERSRIYGTMLESQSGLQSVRFIDSGGSRIHFSTDPQDILRQDQGSVAYRDYNNEGGDIPYEQVAVPNRGKPQITFDEAGERLVFSFPFYDSLDVYRGSVLFSLSAKAVAEQLFREGLIKIGEDVSVISKPGGFILGLPAGGKRPLVPLISSAWSDGILTLTHLVSGETTASLALISAKTGEGIFTGLLVDESLFAISLPMKIILLASFFLTAFLVVFLVFNLRQDPVMVVENRLKKLQISLLEHYYDTADETERNHWSREMEQRREDIRAELKRGLRVKSVELDALIDRSWDDFLSILDRRRGGVGIADEKKLQELLGRVFQTLSTAASAGSIPIPPPAPLLESPSPVSVANKFEGLEDFEELEDNGKATWEGDTRDVAPEEPPIAAAGDSEELEELEEAEEVEEVEGTEEAEEVEELEELGELEEAAELEELEEEATEKGPSGPSMSGARIDEIASEIEFSDSPQTEDDPGEDVPMNLDIASPFDVMSFDDEEKTDPDPGVQENKKKNPRKS